MKRIVIIGTSGSGKTTLGKHLAKKLGYPMTDLDDLYWLPNWTRRPKKEFASLIEKAASHKEWIICGNQSRYRHLFWPKADTIIWLDLPLPLLLWRTVRRSFRNMKTKETFCNGNYESLSRLFSSESILFYVIKGYFKHRKDYLHEMEVNTGKKWIRTHSITPESDLSL
ncbi:MAG: AAA family ATPase [Chlamydiia bacterium]|nr:AAA family ATPase [Chlamydiia bacterium]